MSLYWILGILIVIYLLFEWNMSVYRRFSAQPLATYPRVSILIPCRNEAAGIEQNLRTLFNQDYPDYEIIALDDDSDDGTHDILSRLEKENDRFRCIKGKPLPDGWQGKNHACHQLAQAARGEWFLFVDADTQHDPQMLKRAVQTVVHRQASFLSTFPRQRFSSWGDELVVPMMFFILFMYLPMYFVAKKTWKWAGNFSTACGQFLLIKNEIYNKVGGHEAIQNRISEGPLLAKHVKDSGGKILLLDGSPWVSCQMYTGFKAAFEGFSRSVFASMGGSIGAILFFLVVQTYLFITPYVILAQGLVTGNLSAQTLALILACIAMPLWIRLRIHSRIGMSKRHLIWHVVSITLYHWIMLNSFVHYKIRKNTTWKNRSYVSPQT